MQGGRSPVVPQRSDDGPVAVPAVQQGPAGRESPLPGAGGGGPVGVVQEEGPARSQASFDGGDDARGCGPGLPVSPPRGPQDGPESGRARGEERLGREDSVRRPVPPDRFARDPGEQLGGVTELPAQSARPLRHDAVVVPAVHGQLVPLARDPVDQLGVAGGVPAQDEERGPAPVPGQQVEEVRGRRGVRAVVVGQRDVGRRPQPGEPGGDPAAEGGQREHRRRVRRARGQRCGDPAGAHVVDPVIELRTLTRVDRPPEIRGSQGPARAASSSCRRSSTPRAHGTSPASWSASALLIPWPGRHR